jgi:hypothetical protein
MLSDRRKRGAILHERRVQLAALDLCRIGKRGQAGENVAVRVWKALCHQSFLRGRALRVSYPSSAAERARR